MHSRQTHTICNLINNDPESEHTREGRSLRNSRQTNGVIFWHIQGSSTRLIQLTNRLFRVLCNDHQIWGSSRLSSSTSYYLVSQSKRFQNIWPPNSLVQIDSLSSAFTIPTRVGYRRKERGPELTLPDRLNPYM